MTRRNVWLGICLTLGCLLALPTAARAQSSIAGTVKDTSGAVLPGVTVEVSSPALIEGTKAATTDGSGAFRIVDLRPGMYTVKFTLTGFATVERAAFQLLSDFNARIDAELKVGALAETITVTGAAPIVDVQSAAKVAVLDRDAIDNIPTGKTIQALGQLIVGVALNAPDVGGSAGAMQTYMSLHGTTVNSNNNTVMVDGMVINGLMLNGAVQTYTNDADFQEMTYQTAGIDASRSGGGIALNMVPKEGGNRFSGAATGLYRPAALSASNYSDRFITWGLPKQRNPQKDPATGPFTGAPAINAIKRISDVNGSEGGPIKKDKLWFFVSGRDFQPINKVPNTFLDDGTQGIDDNYIRQALVRLTYQLSPKHKLGAYYERVFKWRGHDLQPFNDPETVGIVWTSPNYSTMAVKYTGTISSKLLVEGGFSQNAEYYRNLFEPGIQQTRPSTSTIFNVPGSPIFNASLAADPQTGTWYSMANHSTPVGGSGVAAAGTVSQFPLSQVWQGSASYVTGAHHAKAGFSLRVGKFQHGGDNNADLTQSYPTFNRVAADFTLSDGTTVKGNYNIYFPQSNLTAAQFAGLFPTVDPVTGLAIAANVALFTNGRAAGPCSIGTPTATVASQSTCTTAIRNSPRLYQETLNHDAGVFLQDSYTMKRLTVNAGLRYELLDSQIDNITAAAGRFVPARATTPDKLPQGGKNIPNWKDWAPRLQLVYDLRGDSKTAIKYSINRYNESITLDTAQAFNPIVFTTNSRNWTDLNGDDIVQGGVTYDAAGTRIFCTYLTPGCEINLSGLAGITQTGLDPQFGLLQSAGTYTQFPRQYHIEQGIEVQHALLPRLSLTGTYYHGVYHNFTQSINWNRRDLASTMGTANAQYAPVTIYNPIDGTPYLYYNAVATITTNTHTQQDTKRTQTYDSWTGEVRLRPYAGAQLTGGVDFERTLNNTCNSSQTRTAAGDATAIAAGTSTWQTTEAEGSAAVIDPNTLRFCNDKNLVPWSGLLGGNAALTTATTLLVNGVQVGALPRQGKAFTKTFKVSGSFPTIFGMNLGFSYQNVPPSGGFSANSNLTPTYRYGTAFKYPDGTNAFTSLTKSTALTACPTTYGCVPGGATTVANLSSGATGTVIGNMDANGFADERIVQLDLKLSKNFRFGKVSIQPQIEAFNVLNVDEVRGRLSSEYAAAAGTYLVPSNVLQGRIIGFGANIKW